MRSVPGRRTALMPMRVLVALATIGAMTALAQPVYQWTDEQGVVHFSDSNVPPEVAKGAAVHHNRRAPTTPAKPPASGRIPLVSRDGKKFVRVVLEGRSSREILMLVDTGAQITMIDEGLASDLRLEFVRDAGIIGVTGVAPGWIGRLRRLRMEGQELSNWMVMVGPQPGMHLLGMDVLDHLRLAVGMDALEAR